MSLTPTTPDYKAALRTFWQRPEGKTGAVILLATILAGVYGFSLILPWLILLLANTVEAAALAAVLFGTLCVVSSRRFRSLVGNTFQMSMRWLTGIVIEIDPVGIMRNTLERAQKTLAQMSTAIGGVNGARAAVQAQIDKNNAIIRKATSLKQQADKQLTTERDPLTRQRLALDQQRELQEIGRRMHSNEKLTVILNQTTKMYDMLGRFRNLGDFNVENLQAEIENADQERKAILDSYRGMSLAKKLIQGDPEQLRMYNQSLEYLAEDNAKKFGEMEDFANYSQKYLTEMDLEQGAAAGDAEKMLASFETKLLGAGGAQSGPAIPVNNPVATSDYSDLLK